MYADTFKENTNALNKFNFTTEDGKNIEYEKLLSFRSKKNGKFYLVVTDNTRDEFDNLNIYAYYISDNFNFSPVEDELELEMVTDVYNRVKGEI